MGYTHEVARTHIEAIVLMLKKSEDKLWDKLELLRSGKGLLEEV